MQARSARDWRRRFVALNVLGGSAVLASYAWGMANPVVSGGLWGGVPESWRPLYQLDMLLAAAGYFPFTGYWLVRAEPQRLLLGLYALILLPSALWLPLTAAYLDAPSPALWALIRIDLALVSIGALGNLAALLAHAPGTARTWRAVAVIGALAFVSQTAVLDALVWPAYFRR